MDMRARASTFMIRAMKYSILFGALLVMCSCSPTETVADRHADDRFWIETKLLSPMEWTFVLRSHPEDPPLSVLWNFPSESQIVAQNSANITFKSPGTKPASAQVVTKAGDTLVLSTHVNAGELRSEVPSREFFASAKVAVTFWGDHVVQGLSNVHEYKVLSSTANPKATDSKVEDTLISWTENRSTSDGISRLEMRFSPTHAKVTFLKMDYYSHSESSDWIEHFEHSILLPELHFEGANDTMAVYSYQPIGSMSSGHPEFGFVYYSYSVHIGKSGSGAEYKGTNWNGSPKPFVQVTFTRVK